MDESDRQEKRMDKDTWLKGAKVAFGSAAAIFLAELFGADYAASAGIITLLTIQDTRKDTFQMALQRLVSFVLFLFLAVFLHITLGLYMVGFGVYLFFMALLSYCFHWEGAVSTNAVFGTHVFMLDHMVTAGFLFNEAALLLIGIGMAILLNLKIPDKEPGLKQELQRAETMLQKILYDIGAHLRDRDALQRTREELLKYMGALDGDIGKAIQNRDITLKEYSTFYIYYFVLRKKQCAVLEHVCQTLLFMDAAYYRTDAVAGFFHSLAAHFDIKEDVALRMAELGETLEKFRQRPMPKEEREFETRAALFHVLKEMELFLKLKREFYGRLTPLQRELYLR